MTGLCINILESDSESDMKTQQINLTAKISLANSWIILLAKKKKTWGVYSSIWNMKYFFIVSHFYVFIVQTWLALTFSNECTHMKLKLQFLHNKNQEISYLIK